MNDAIDQFVDEIDRLSETCAHLQRACAIYRKASIQSHSGHFDRTGQHGMGCEECIKANALRAEADSILATL